jgi:hypothetical protein
VTPLAAKFSLQFSFFLPHVVSRSRPKKNPSGRVKTVGCVFRKISAGGLFFSTSQHNHRLDQSTH